MQTYIFPFMSFQEIAKQKVFLSREAPWGGCQENYINSWIVCTLDRAKEKSKVFVAEWKWKETHGKTSVGC